MYIDDRDTFLSTLKKAFLMMVGITVFTFWRMGREKHLAQMLMQVYNLNYHQALCVAKINLHQQFYESMAKGEIRIPKVFVEEAKRRYAK